MSQKKGGRMKGEQKRVKLGQVEVIMSDESVLIRFPDGIGRTSLVITEKGITVVFTEDDSDGHKLFSFPIDPKQLRANRDLVRTVIGNDRDEKKPSDEPSTEANGEETYEFNRRVS